MKNKIIQTAGYEEKQYFKFDNLRDCFAPLAVTVLNVKGKKKEF